MRFRFCILTLALLFLCGCISLYPPLTTQWNAVYDPTVPRAEWLATWGAQMTMEVTGAIPTADGGYAVIGSEGNWEDYITDAVSEVLARVVAEAVTCYVEQLINPGVPGLPPLVGPSEGITPQFRPRARMQVLLKCNAQGTPEWVARFFVGRTHQQIPYRITETNDMFTIWGEGWTGPKAAIYACLSRQSAVVKSGVVEQSSEPAGWRTICKYLSPLSAKKVKPCYGLRTKDGGFLVVGARSADFLPWPIGSGILNGWVGKFDGGGALVWEREYKIKKKYETSDCPAAVANEGEDGCYFVAGFTDSPKASIWRQYRNAWVIALDRDGNKLWERIHEVGDDSSFKAILPQKTGGVILAGCESVGSMGRLCLAAFDKNGGLQWLQSAGGQTSYSPTQIITTRDGGYCVVGTIGLQGVFLLKLSPVGKLPQPLPVPEVAR